VFEMLGGAGEWSGLPQIREVDEDGGASYPVITGNYRTAARWESAPIKPGTKLATPVPLFTKLAPTVVAEELDRLEHG
jgi:methionyl-tRNA synthetase